jgi:hypothetical protein
MPDLACGSAKYSGNDLARLLPTLLGGGADPYRLCPSLPDSPYRLCPSLTDSPLDVPWTAQRHRTSIWYMQVHYELDRMYRTHGRPETDP